MNPMANQAQAIQISQ